VESSCQDAADETLSQLAQMTGMFESLSCEQAKLFCSLKTGMQTFIQMLCPVSCGLCGSSVGESRSGNNNSGENFNPEEYVFSAVNYHAHLTGREMYTTLLPGNNADGLHRVDIESKDTWIYDNQGTYQFRDDQDAPKYHKVRPGDKIQATCVYDSTSRTDTTRFGPSTYDEMCITQLVLLVDTPDISDAGSKSMITSLNLQTFSCAIDDTSDIWRGVLESGEDGRNIYEDHPMAESDCTFPVGTFYGGLSLKGDTTPTGLSRCSSDIDQEEAEGVICYGTGEDTIFLEDAIAGESCTGGDMDGADSNDASSYALETEDFTASNFKEACIKSLGVHSRYTCKDAQDWLTFDPEALQLSEYVEYMREYWWQPKCCTKQQGSVVTNDAAVEKPAAITPNNPASEKPGLDVTSDGQIIDPEERMPGAVDNPEDLMSEASTSSFFFVLYFCLCAFGGLIA